MSEQDFLVAIKSTIDKVGYDLAQQETPVIQFIDLDNVVNTEELLQSDNDALVWSMESYQTHPKDPLYKCSFSIGARTVNDSANYDILVLCGKLKEAFRVEQTVDIKDYTGLVAGPKIGVLTVISAAVMPQEFDKVAGIRMVMLNARALRIG